jgi:hypothetical protein
MTVDGKVLARATISAVFGEAFEVSIPDSGTERNAMLPVLLSAGALPATVRLLSTEPTLASGRP